MSTQPALQPLDSKKLIVEKAESLKSRPPNSELVFGKSFSDHMVNIDWNAQEGWQAPRIEPYGKISLEPSAVVFHYGFECFEGMKAYKDKAGKIRLFRPDMNLKRLNVSSERIALPSFSEPDLLEILKEFLRVEKNWIPDSKGFSLYLRPTMIGTQETLGVGASDAAKLFIIACPVGPYYKTGFNAVRLLADPGIVRAWPGGVGSNKVGGNYAPCVKTQLEAAKKGYQQNLWLFGEDHQVTEVGTMNFFLYWKNKDGETELVTPPLDGCILPGVTRDSILGLTRQWGEFKVREGKITMSEIVEGLKENRVMELFGAGTACIISPIKEINYLGKDLAIPLDPKDPNAQAGPLARRLNDALLSIQYGETEHEWSVVVD